MRRRLFDGGSESESSQDSEEEEDKKKRPADGYLLGSWTHWANNCPERKSKGKVRSAGESEDAKSKYGKILTLLEGKVRNQALSSEHRQSHYAAPCQFSSA